ncbi:MAG: hypothetical protein M3Y27_21640 [Acidobacteriota bacterium]|nr:hypothetical protein [Acidobacteriota bacterium]
MMYKQRAMGLDNALEDAAPRTVPVNYTSDMKEGAAAFTRSALRSSKGGKRAG